VALQAAGKSKILGRGELVPVQKLVEIMYTWVAGATRFVSANEMLATQENNPVNCAKNCTVAAGMRYWFEDAPESKLSYRL
jgi:hypothetical protein